MTRSPLSLPGSPPRRWSVHGSIPLAVALMLVLAAHGSATARAGRDTLTVAERVHGLSTIWKEAAYNFPYFDQLPELHWDSAYRAAVPRVISASSTLDYYQELHRFMALLHDGHSRVQLPDTILRRRPFSSPWVDLEAVSGQAVVSNVAVTLADSVPLGSEVVAVEGVTVDRYLEEEVYPFVFASAPHSRRISGIEGSTTRGYGLLVGPAGEPVQVTLRTPTGGLRTISLRRDGFKTRKECVELERQRRRPLLELSWRDGDFAHLNLNSFS